MDCDEFRARFESFGRTIICIPLDVDFVRRFNEFVAAYPCTLSWPCPHPWKPDNGTKRTLLTALFEGLARAVQYQYPFATWRALVIQTPQVLSSRDTDDGWTLLHCACCYNPNALDVISLFVEQYPDATKLKNELGSTPLHIACGNDAPVPVLRALVRANPKSVHSRDKLGDTPLHDACFRGISLDAIRYVAMQEPGICLRRNRDGETPLDQAKDPPEGSARNHNVIDFMTRVTEIVANVVAERLCFVGPSSPREIFEQVATFAHGQPAAASMVKLALSGGELTVLFRRGNVIQDLRAQFQTE